MWKDQMDEISKLLGNKYATRNLVGGLVVTNEDKSVVVYKLRIAKMYTICYLEQRENVTYDALMATIEKYLN